ncbi:MAG: hypothetical protein Q7T63_17025 [Burkholderiaceae bacterium]|nr:hypothetical protein [Burkholderiaceae bacterium]MDP3139461.1 hypothetical protein [Burkholderiaceae bacterium]
MNDLPIPLYPPVVNREDQLKALAQVFGDEYANDFNDPVIFRVHTFESPAVKQFYKREFPLISRTLFVESVYRRRPMYNQDLLDSFAATAAKKLGDILQMLTTQCQRLEKICKTNGQTPDAVYLHAQLTTVPIIASHANTYIKCLLKLDQLYQLSGSATLNGVIDGNQRKQVELLCRKAVRAFSALLRNEILKLRKESYRMRQAASVADEEVDKAEAAQAAAIKEFDAQVQREDGIDPAAAVDPASAAATIDAMAATVAAAAGAKNPRKRKDSPDLPAEVLAGAGAAAS